MSDILLNVLSMDSVEILRHHLPHHSKELKDFDETSVAALDLKYIDTKYRFDKDAPTLLFPENFEQAGLKDAENCKKILSILPGLSPAEATDERIWVTLSVLHFRDYALARWPFEQQSRVNTPTHIKNHWFANGIRPRMRDNAISRLWWMGHIASKIPGRSMDEVFEILFFNSDYRSSLLERNSSANSVNVTASILAITKEAYDANVPYHRDSFREFMKQVDLLGGRTILAAMSTENLTILLKPIYRQCYNMGSEF
jgi:hypothetical protein